MTTREWLRAYAQLALRVNRRLTAGTGGTMLIYQGPVGWSDEVTRESPPRAQRLVEDADRLLEQVPFDAERAAYVSAHVRAMRAVARRLGGEQAPLRDYARR